MKYGMPSLIELPALEDNAKLCRELELDFVELNMNFYPYQPHFLERSGLRELGQRYGVGFTIHLDENMNMADFNPKVAKAYRETAVETIGLAAREGIPVLNMHMPTGVYATLPTGRVYLFETYKDAFLEQMLLFREECHRAVGDSGVKLCVENLTGYTPWQVEALDLLLERPCFGLTYDTGHDHCRRGVDLPRILERKTRLHHMHLHDVVDGKDHRALGTGTVEKERCLTLAKEQNASVVLEIKTEEALRQSVRWLRNRDGSTG